MRDAAGRPAGESADAQRGGAEPGGSGGGSGARRIGAVAALLAASVLLSRLLGFVREAVLAWRVGVSPETDAYFAAFQLPDLLNYFLAGGALSIAFIPLYQQARSRAGDAEAHRLLGVVLGSVGAIAVVATVLLWVFAEPLLALQFPRFDPAQQALLVRLTRIVLPAQICFICGGVIRAALMAEGRFASQAAAPLLYNGGIIAGGVLLAPRLGVEGFAWGALGGAIVGALGAALLEARGRIPLRPRIALRDPGFRQYLWVAAPLMLGVTLLTVDEWYDRWFGQLAGTGVIAVLVYGRRLLHVPVAAIGQTLATAALPVLARLHGEGRADELERLLSRVLRAGGALGVVGGAALFALADPLVTLVYVRGAFTPGDAAPVATALRIFSFAVPGWIVQQVAARAFYARGDTWRPMLLGTAVAVLVVPLYLSLAPAYGAPGLAAAGVLGVSANALATLVLARRLHGGPPLAPFALSLLRALLAAAPAALLARWLLPGDPGAAGALLDLAVGGAVLLAVGGPALWWLGDASLRDELSRLARALARRRLG